MVLDYADILRRSEKFLKWQPFFGLNPALVDEKHYAPDELAELWGVSAETIRNVFREEPGVLRFSQPKQAWLSRRRRKYVSMRIPKSVAERVHKKLSAVPAATVPG
jgi:hypothetical protein